MSAVDYHPGDNHVTIWTTYISSSKPKFRRARRELCWTRYLFRTWRQRAEKAMKLSQAFEDLHDLMKPLHTLFKQDTQAIRRIPTLMFFEKLHWDVDHAMNDCCLRMCELRTEMQECEDNDAKQYAVEQQQIAVDFTEWWTECFLHVMWEGIELLKQIEVANPDEEGMEGVQRYQFLVVDVEQGGEGEEEIILDEEALPGEESKHQWIVERFKGRQRNGMRQLWKPAINIC
ncbi:hypothetical protein BU23DRAFT_575108 [Bimuria novae-zelandiae CBS 107.79]|uniref:Uncharacterized protein n=1 Tax=Bimuria novae-zelandiae CBS 107.79 TaxID=1447943 RepID=A0A6A5UQD3_9PLEO|nr:hypothetical protein BU23DRAFT_575108 [Bimuria novae-zelandiae CBS 107.79]